MTDLSDGFINRNADGIDADGDPTAERAVSDPIGRRGVVALPSVREPAGGLGVMPPAGPVLTMGVFF